MQARQDGEDRLFALSDLTVEHIVGFIELGKTRCAVDDGDSIDVVEMVFAVIDGDAELFSGACSEDVDGVGDRGTREEFRLQFLSILVGIEETVIQMLQIVVVDGEDGLIFLLRIV